MCVCVFVCVNNRRLFWLPKRFFCQTADARTERVAAWLHPANFGLRADQMEWLLLGASSGGSITCSTVCAARCAPS